MRQRVGRAAASLDETVQAFVAEALRIRLAAVESPAAPSDALAAFADDVVELLRRGDYRRDIDALGDADLAVE
jgi:hypothetical protein